MAVARVDSGIIASSAMECNRRLGAPRALMARQALWGLASFANPPLAV